MITATYLTRKRQEAFLKHKDHFWLTFGKPLRHYFSEVQGLNMHRFMQDFKIPEGRPLEEVVAERYGIPARRMINELL